MGIPVKNIHHLIARISRKKEKKIRLIRLPCLPREILFYFTEVGRNDRIRDDKKNNSFNSRNSMKK